MPRVDWTDTIEGGLPYMQLQIPEIRGFADPFASTTDQFNNFSNPVAFAESFSRAISMGESFLCAANTGGWGIPQYETAFAASFDLVVRAKEFLLEAMNALREFTILGFDGVDNALKAAGNALQNVIGPAMGAITGAIPIIGQVVQAVLFVYRSVKRLLKWLNRTGPKPRPAEPLTRPQYSASADLDRTRATVNAIGQRIEGVSPNLTSYFSPPVWGDRLLDNQYNDVCSIIKSYGMRGILEVGRLSDGTKVVRQRPAIGDFDAGGWSGRMLGLPKYAPAFPSLVPGSGIGDKNPSQAHSGILVLSKGRNGKIEVTDMAVRFPQYSTVAGPSIGQLSRYGPSLYSLAASTLRARWRKYLAGWYHGLAAASNSQSWGALAGFVSPGCYDIGGEMSVTFQWRNMISPDEAWAIRRYFGENFSTPKTPQTARASYPERKESFNLGGSTFPWRDALLFPDTSIPCVAMAEMYNRQEKCLRHGATALYLQPEDDALAGADKVGGDHQLALRKKWNDRIVELATFATAKDAGIVCSTALEPSMVVSQTIRDMLQSKRLSAGAGNLSACSVHKMSTYQISEDPTTPAQPSEMSIVGSTQLPGEEKGSAGVFGLAALALLGLFAAKKK